MITSPVDDMDLARISQSPTEPRFVQDPYSFYSAARSKGDFFYWPDYDRVCASTYRAVDGILRDRRWGREVPEEFREPVPKHIEPFMRIEANSMLEIDPPRHTRLRGLVLRAFTPRRIEALVPEIELLSKKLVTGFDADGTELLAAFGQRLPVIVIARLLGVPDDMADRLLAWSHDMVAMYQARRDTDVELLAAAAADEFAEYIGNLAAERRRHPGNDLVSQLVAAKDGGRWLSEGEITSSCILLLNAGHEATVHTIGNGVRLLLEKVENPASICAGDGIGRLVEEILRFDPPLHMFERHAKEDMVCFGHQFKRGDRVALLLASANRDENFFGHDAGKFRPDRNPNRHLSFGAGAHFCLGAALARQELSISLRALFREHSRMRLSAPPVYANCYHFHGLESLQVEFG